MNNIYDITATGNVKENILNIVKGLETLDDHDKILLLNNCYLCLKPNSK